MSLTCQLYRLDKQSRWRQDGSAALIGCQPFLLLAGARLNVSDSADVSGRRRATRASARHQALTAWIAPETDGSDGQRIGSQDVTPL